MSVTLDEVRRIASLAGLRLTPGEEERVAERMAEIVRFAARMAEPSDEPARRSSPGESAVREREDVPRACLDRRVVMANAPDRREGFVRLAGMRRPQRHGRSVDRSAEDAGKDLG